MRRSAVIGLRSTFAWCATVMLVACASDSASPGSFGDLGLASAATLRAKAYQDAVYLRVNKSPVYDPDFCGGTVSGANIVESMPSRFYRVSFDGTSVAELTPSQPLGVDYDFAPAYGPGAALRYTGGVFATAGRFFLTIFDGTRTFDVATAALVGPDAALTEGESPSSTVVVDLVVEPSALRAYFLDEAGRLRKFETGSRRTLTTLDPGFAIVSMNATQMTLARIDSTNNTLVVEQRSLADGGLIGSALTLALTRPARRVVPFLSNGTPGDARIFVESSASAALDVVRLSGTSIVEEFSVTGERFDTRFGDVSFACTLLDGTVFRFDENAEATLLATAAELADTTCREDPEVEDSCGRRQHCRAARAVSASDDADGVAFLYESRFPSKTTISVSSVAPRPTREVTAAETFPVRVVSLVRAADHGDAATTMPALVVSTEEPVTGTRVPVTTVNFGEASSFVDVPRRGGLSGEGMILNLAFGQAGTPQRLVLDPAEIANQAAVGLTVVVWQEPGLAPGYELFWQNPNADSFRGTTALVLQSDTNAATGFAWYREESFDACEEAYCHQVACTRMARSRVTGDVMSSLGPPAATAPIRTRTRLVYSSTALEGAAACEGEVFYDEAWQTGDSTTVPRVIAVHALAPGGGAIVHLEGGLP